MFVSFSLYFASSRADTGPTAGTTEAEITNAAPEIASVVISTNATPGTLTSDSDYDTPSAVIGTQGSITPTASTTLQAYAHIIARDINGWEDIDPDSADPGSIAYSGYIKNNGAGQCGPETNYDCYLPFSFANCTKIASDVNAIQVRCPVTLTWYTKSGTWDVQLTVDDRASSSDTFTGTFTVNALLAYTVSTSAIDFGMVSLPFSGITNSNKEVVFANVGNTDIADLQVDHSAMTCLVGAASGGSIPAASMAYGTSTIASLSDYYVTGLTTGTPVPFPTPAQTTATQSFKSLYNHLVSVPSGTAGTCAGTITLTPSS